MQLGMVGLGRMGQNMVVRMAKAGHQIVVLDRDPKVVQETLDRVKNEGGKVPAVGASDPKDLISFCWDGKVTKTGPTTFEMDATDWSPPYGHELEILLLKHQDPQQNSG